MEKFLAFWSHYNATIIETLVALILLSALYLAYRTFFGNKGMDTLESTDNNAAGVNTAQIEKTLQKILDQQSSLKNSTGVSVAGSGGGDSVPAELLQELGALKAALDEKEKQIIDLQQKAVQAANAAKASDAGPNAEAMAASASAAAGLAEQERADFEAKIKELEARLAEYEIISEDIADLSFFKEENARLTKELESIRGGGGGASGAPAGGAAPAAAPASDDPAAAAMPEASAEASGAIDDSLMAEFAKAVEGQKSGTLEEAPKSEDSKLLEEFENFNKKS